MLTILPQMARVKVRFFGLHQRLGIHVLIFVSLMSLTGGCVRRVASTTGTSRPLPDGRSSSFYVGLLGGRRLWTKDSSVGVEVLGAVLIAQRIEGYRSPDWPGSSTLHLDLSADDLDAAVGRAVALGATLPGHQPDERLG